MMLFKDTVENPLHPGDEMLALWGRDAIHCMPGEGCCPGPQGREPPREADVGMRDSMARLHSRLTDIDNETEFLNN